MLDKYLSQSLAQLGPKFQQAHEPTQLQEGAQTSIGRCGLDDVHDTIVTRECFDLCLRNRAVLHMGHESVQQISSLPPKRSKAQQSKYQ